MKAHAPAPWRGRIEFALAGSVALPLLVLAGAAHAQGQRSVAGRPAAAPSTHLEGSADARWLRLGDTGGAAAAAAVRGGWSPRRHLELGAAAGVRAWHLRSAEGARAAGRLGLAPVELSTGTGTRRGPVGLGVRLAAALGPGLLGAGQLDPETPRGALALRAATSHCGRWHATRLETAVGMAWNGPGSWIGAVDLRTAFGPARWAARPLVTAVVQWVQRARAAVRLGVGTVVRPAAELRLRATLVVPIPGDPEGMRFGGALGLVWTPSRDQGAPKAR